MHDLLYYMCIRHTEPKKQSTISETSYSIRVTPPNQMTTKAQAK